MSVKCTKCNDRATRRLSKDDFDYSNMWPYCEHHYRIAKAEKELLMSGIRKTPKAVVCTSTADKNDDLAKRFRQITDFRYSLKNR